MRSKKIAKNVRKGKEKEKNIGFNLFSYKAAYFRSIHNITLHSLRVVHRTIVQWIQAYTLFLRTPTHSAETELR